MIKYLLSDGVSKCNALFSCRRKYNDEVLNVFRSENATVMNPVENWNCYKGTNLLTRKTGQRRCCLWIGHFLAELSVRKHFVDVANVEDVTSVIKRRHGVARAHRVAHGLPDRQSQLKKILKKNLSLKNGLRKKKQFFSERNKTFFFLQLQFRMKIRLLFSVNCEKLAWEVK